MLLEKKIAGGSQASWKATLMEVGSGNIILTFLLIPNILHSIIDVFKNRLKDTKITNQ